MKTKICYNQKHKQSASGLDKLKSPVEIDKFDAIPVKAATKVKVSGDTLSAEEKLNKLVGLANVKSEISKLKAVIKKNPGKKPNLNMCFMGNPGTGKTEVARLLAEIYTTTEYCRKTNINNGEMKMINTMDEAILNSNKGVKNTEGNMVTNSILYSRWEKRYAKTIKDFYKDFIEPRLPDIQVLEKWNDLLLWYIDQPDAIYFYRGGRTDPMCRRGWMNVLKNPTDPSMIRYIYDDNNLALYFYKMALDGYCPKQAEFLDFMTVFKDPQNIGWLNKNAKAFVTLNSKSRKYLSMPGHFIPNKGYEYAKNVLLLNNQGPVTCCLGDYNYKHSHVFDIKKPYVVNGQMYGNKCAITDKYFGIEENDAKYYTYDTTIGIYYRVRQVESNSDFILVKELLKAHTLRFLNPYNHFLAPHQGCNKYTKNDGSFDSDIAEYDKLLNYIVAERRKTYPNFAKFEEQIRWEGPCVDENTGDDVIDVIYHEKTLSDKKIYKGYNEPNGYANKVNNKKSTGRTQTNTKSARKTQTNTKFVTPEICFIPSDKSEFIKEFQKKKKAEITITKSDGTTEGKVWKCEKMSQTSDPTGNLLSKGWYRKNKHLYTKIVCEVK